MARYIDADKLKGWLRLDQAGTKNTVTHQSEGLHPIRIMQLKCFIGDIEYCLSKINEAPTADVVEVVRCNNCEYFHHSGYCTQTGMSKDRFPNDFCSYAVRKEDENVHIND